MDYRVSIAFRVDRRIGWDHDDFEALRNHLKSVKRHLLDNQHLHDSRLLANLAQATLSIEMTVAAETSEAADRLAREYVSEALWLSGATHDGLLSLAEESAMRWNLNAWSGLTTPRWLKRSVDLVEAA